MRGGGTGGGQREHDGGEFRLVEVALIVVIEDNVPDEFAVCGDVMVCDHAVVPQEGRETPKSEKRREEDDKFFGPMGREGKKFLGKQASLAR